jgi:hypothetical protein
VKKVCIRRRCLRSRGLRSMGKALLRKRKGERRGKRGDGRGKERRERERDNAKQLWPCLFLALCLSLILLQGTIWYYGTKFGTMVPTSGNHKHGSFSFLLFSYSRSIVAK